MKNVSGILICLGLCALLLVSTAQASDKLDAEGLVDKATPVVTQFANDPELGSFKELAQKAKAILVIPQSIKGAFLVGGSGGSGVLVARDSAGGGWGYPAFYTMGAVSVGLQIGGEASEVVLLVMTERGLESLLTSSVKLGADVKIAVGPKGAGVAAQTADVYSFSRAKGAFVGAALDGAVVKTRDGLNNGYYGKEISPTDIIIRKTVTNPQADGFRMAVEGIAGK